MDYTLPACSLAREQEGRGECDYPVVVHAPDLIGLVILVLLGAGLVAIAGAGAVLWRLFRPARKTFATALGMGLATDPGEMGLEAEAVTFELQGKGSSPGWIIKGRAADGPTVIVVHGFEDSRYGALTWTPLLLPFASRVVVYDLRGHGESATRYATCGPRDAADLRAVIEQVTARGRAAGDEATGRIVLFGYSMGAGIAIAAAAAEAVEEEGGRPGPVAGVIGDGAYRLWDEPIKRHIRLGGYPPQPFVTLAGLVLRATMADDDPFDRAVHAARLRCPLLLLHGREDPLCPLSSARQVADAADDGTWVVFDHAAHLDLAAVDEKRYREVLANYFAKLRDRV